MSTQPFIGAKEYFPGIGAIPYEGPKSDNPLAFKVYDADRKIGGKTMREHLRFAVCYWHTFCNAGADPFGPGTRHFPWERDTAMATAEAKAPLKRLVTLDEIAQLSMFLCTDAASGMTGQTIYVAAGDHAVD